MDYWADVLARDLRYRGLSRRTPAHPQFLRPRRRGVLRQLERQRHRAGGPSGGVSGVGRRLRQGAA